MSRLRCGLGPGPQPVPAAARGQRGRPSSGGHGVTGPPVSLSRGKVSAGNVRRADPWADLPLWATKRRPADGFAAAGSHAGRPSRCQAGERARGHGEPVDAAAADTRPARAGFVHAHSSRSGRVRAPQGTRLRHDPGGHRDPAPGGSAARPDRFDGGRMFGGWDVADPTVESCVVVPVDPLGGGEFDGGQGVSRTSEFDQFRLAELKEADGGRIPSGRRRGRRRRCRWIRRCLTRQVGCETERGVLDGFNSPCRTGCCVRSRCHRPISNTEIRGRSACRWRPTGRRRGARSVHDERDAGLTRDLPAAGRCEERPCGSWVPAAPAGGAAERRQPVLDSRRPAGTYLVNANPLTFTKSDVLPEENTR